jgi:hypothetical protein
MLTLRRSALDIDREIDRGDFIESLGGGDAVARMDHEARADAIEEYQSSQLEAATAKPKAPAGQTVAEVEAEIDTRAYRRGAGKLFIAERGTVKRLPPMPARPTLVDFFERRFQSTQHVLQSASLAQRGGASEEVVLACLLHDLGQSLMRTDHGWWSAQIFEPYVSERVTFAIRYHQALRFYADPAAGYEYPELYYKLYGVDYEPPPHVAAAYETARRHKWYGDARLVTTNDLYAFDQATVVTLDPFVDLIARRFKQPPEGLGNDNTPVAHMWRTLATPDAPL